MGKSTRKRLIMLVALAVFLATPLGWPVNRAAMNIVGVCVDEMRFLSDEEKIDAAVKSELAHYPPVFNLGFTELHSGRESDKAFGRKPDEPIPYRNLDEFRRVNPDCCALPAVGRMGYTRSFWDIVTGRTSGFVRIRYLVRYSDETGAAKAAVHTVYPAISNCGRVWSGV